MSKSLSSGSLKVCSSMEISHSRQCKISCESRTKESVWHTNFNDSLGARELLDADIRAGSLCQNLRTEDERRPILRVNRERLRMFFQLEQLLLFIAFTEVLVGERWVSWV